MPNSPSTPGERERFLTVRGLPILLDTNILIQGSGGKTLSQRRAIHEFCKQNDVCICDTVYYEYLRNCNYENFKEKRTEVEDWPCSTGRMTVRREKEAKKTFELLWILYLQSMRKEPKRFVHQNMRDLWIASAAVHYGVDRILTTDHGGDFPVTIFDDASFDLSEPSAALVLHLKTFNRPFAREQWLEMRSKKKIEVDFRSFG